MSQQEILDYITQHPGCLQTQFKSRQVLRLYQKGEIIRIRVKTGSFELYPIQTKPSTNSQRPRNELWGIDEHIEEDA